MKSSLSAKGQITVPIAVRRRLGWTPGTKVSFTLTRGGALLKKKSSEIEDGIDKVYGTLKLAGGVDAAIDRMRGPAPSFIKKRR